METLTEQIIATFGSEHASDDQDQNSIYDSIQQTVDMYSGDYLSDLEHAEIEFHPYYIDALLEDLTNFLSTAHSHYAVAQDLAEKIVRQTLETNLRLRRSNIERREIEHLHQNLELLAKSIGRQSHLTRETVDGTSTYSVSNEHTALLKAHDEVLLALKKEELDEKDQYEALLKENRSKPGHALNLIYRFKRSRKLFRENIREAYKRARSIEVGLPLVYGNIITDHLQSLTLNPVSNGYMFELLDWRRNLFSTLERLLEHDSEYVITVPFRNELWLAGQSHERVSIPHPNILAGINSGDFSVLENPSPQKFKLPESARRHSNTRVQSVAITLFGSNELEDNDTMDVRIVPPVQPESAIESGLQFIPPAIILTPPGKRLGNLSEDDFVEGPFLNIDPFAPGDWGIHIGKYTFKGKPPVIVEMHLHLKVVGTD